jgi:hypothetical protein
VHRRQDDRLLVSETVWRTLYGADPGLVGRTITVNNERLVVIGILPAEFRFPSAATVLWKPTDLASTPGEQARAYVRFAAAMPRDEALRLATEAARAADVENASLRPWVQMLAGMDDEYSRRAVPLLAGGVGLPARHRETPEHDAVLFDAVSLRARERPRLPGPRAAVDRGCDQADVVGGRRVKKKKLLSPRRKDAKEEMEKRT